MYGATSGYRTEGDAGLSQVGARYYDPQVGRFITRDAYLDQKPYLYCEHDPVNNLDPTGHKISPDGELGAGVGFIGIGIAILGVVATTVVVIVLAPVEIIAAAVVVVSATVIYGAIAVGTLLGTAFVSAGACLAIHACQRSD